MLNYSSQDYELTFRFLFKVLSPLILPRYSAQNASQKTFVCFFCLFVCDPQPHFSRGVNSQRRTYGDHPLPPRPLVTPGPCVSVCSLSPHTFVLNASCIRSVPSPVLLSYTYTLSSLWSVSLSYTYIQTPQKRTPQHISNPTNKRC